MGTLTSNTGMAFSKWYDSVHGEPSYQETFEAGAAWQAAQAAQPAQNEWKEAVIEQLAAHSMDAPISDSPTVILAKIIHMAVLQATDPAIKVAQPAHAHAIDTSPERVEKQAGDVQVPIGRVIYEGVIRWDDTYPPAGTILYAAPSTKEGQQ